MHDTLSQIPSPCYVLEEELLRRNLALIRSVKEAAGVNIILAFKAYALWKSFPVIREYIPHSTASSIHEARLAFDEMGSPAHTYSPAYTERDFPTILKYSSHITFNSLTQFERFYPQVVADGNRVSCGLRINPEYSEVETDLYNPCAPGSRLGITADKLPELPQGVEGLHFHTLCEQDADALAVTLKAVEEKFADLLPKMKWVNFGGGHHVTRPGYDLATLEQCICQVQAKYGVRVYLEPGEAWALNAGYLVTTVLDTLCNGDTHLAILDTSAACHTPDVIEMPYRPPLLEAGDPGEQPCTVRLGGPTCLAGDVMGDYSFKAPLAPGQRLVFGDMAIYTTCKNNTFNGMPLPDIWLLRSDGSLARLAHFGYQDFRCRLGGRGEGTLDTTSVQI